MSLLEVKDINKSFGGLQALSGINFAVREGEMVGIIGPNGAGKTTLFNVISGFMIPDKGEMLFEGHSIINLKPNEICKLGIARTFQIVKPFNELSVFQNILIGLLNRRKNSPDTVDKAIELLTFGGLFLQKDKKAQEITLCDRKRIELVRAYATQPKLLLLDEVMAGLNETEIVEVIELIKDINNQGITMILIEHVMKAIMSLSDRIIVLNYGEKIAEGLPEDIVKNEKVIEAYLGEEYAHARS